MMVGRLQFVLIGFALLCGTSPVLAQGSGAEAELLRSNEVLDQLELSEQQSTRLTEAMKGGSPPTSFFEPYLSRMKEVKEESERTKIREEMQAALQKAKEEASGAVFAVLDDRHQQPRHRRVARDLRRPAARPERDRPLPQQRLRRRDRGRVLSTEVEAEDRERHSSACGSGGQTPRQPATLTSNLSAPMRRRPRGSSER